MSSTEPRRIGFFGGTFDPPHVGHLLAAGDAAERLQLDLVLWVPVGTQPLKPGGTSVSGEHRLRMVELTVQGHPSFRADATEVRRGGLSFTVDTLGELHGRHPGAELFLLLGTDSWRSFERWREPSKIRELAQVAILCRETPADDRDPVERSHRTEAPLWLATRRVDVSATEIRSRIRDGLPIRGFVMESVERYIGEHGLYA